MIVGILGLGYWGPNLVRNFLAQSEVSKVIGCDLRPERLKFISERYPSVHLLNDSNELIPYEFGLHQRLEEMLIERLGENYPWIANGIDGFIR